MIVISQESLDKFKEQGDAIEKKRLEYIMSVDFECMLEVGNYTKEQAEEWFYSDECVVESYGGRYSIEEIKDTFNRLRERFDEFYELWKQKNS